MIADKAAIRDAAAVIVLRDPSGTPSVLMGQRGKTAAFMPNKFVFPGGALDAEDAHIPLASPIPEPCFTRLDDETPAGMQTAIGAAAIREFWEETGLILGTPGHWPDAPPDWKGFAATGHCPDAGGLQFVFRAVTPRGRPRRFDARFFLVDADRIQGDLDDFSRASDELSHLQWVPLSDARQFHLPFITEVILAEITARVTDPTPPNSVPFFNNNDEASLLLRLRGRTMPEHD